MLLLYQPCQGADISAGCILSQQWVLQNVEVVHAWICQIGRIRQWHAGSNENDRAYFFLLVLSRNFDQFGQQLVAILMKRNAIIFKHSPDFGHGFTSVREYIRHDGRLQGESPGQSLLVKSTRSLFRMVQYLYGCQVPSFFLEERLHDHYEYPSYHHWA